jgi:hypothetical protein
MRNLIRSLGIIALALTASSAAYADVHVTVGINPFGWLEPVPPVVYQPPRYYATPPVVYYGRGHWGDQHDSRARHPEHGRSDHHNDGDDRR